MEINFETGAYLTPHIYLENDEKFYMTSWLTIYLRFIKKGQVEVELKKGILGLEYCNTFPKKLKKPNCLKIR